MAIQSLFDDASRIMTVISFTTFIGIVAWTYLRRERDFAAAAHIPFADEETGEGHV
nr:cbb3-type cytochrome c oxidase subunit 3 [uncultured Massilia sp.]